MLTKSFDIDGHFQRSTTGSALDAGALLVPWPRLDEDLSGLFMLPVAKSLPHHIHHIHHTVQWVSLFLLMFMELRQCNCCQLWWIKSAKWAELRTF